MNSPAEKCPECGAKLPPSREGGRCQKCLLRAGLASQSELGSDDLAATLQSNAPAGSRPVLLPSGSVRHDDGNGIGAYRYLAAVHDWSGGTVYSAYHPGLDRRVWLRVLDASADATARNEFLTRAEALSHLNHRNTVTTLEAGEDDAVAYVAEELIDGRPIGGFLPRNWRERWREGFFPGQDVIAAMRDAALGLHAIHETGLVHGRLNPDSILIDQNAVVRVVGLGEASEANDDRFASPDALEETPVAADIYRLGATFCFLVTGKLPAEITSDLSAVNFARGLKKCNPGLQRDFCQLIAGCLDQRTGLYKDAGAVATDLNRLLATRVTRAPWRQRVYSALLEGFVLMMLMGLSLVNRETVALSGLSLAAILTLPTVYTIFFESAAGWTFGRRVFGLRLLNHAGERCCWWQRLCRGTLKWFLLAILLLVPSLILPFFSGATARPQLAILISMIWPFLSLFLVYLPARWIPSRWTFYDLLAGVTWGEEIRTTPATDIPSHANAADSARGPATRRIDQYDIHETLGSGGMGHVYRGRDRVLGRDVAVKVLAENLRRNPLLLERFQREARLAAKVSHPNVAKVFGNGTWNGTPYIAMEFVHGRNLQEVIKEEGRLSVPMAWDFIIQAAEALRAAYRGGVVHRDIKPANLMIAKNSQLKVTDFGISRQVIDELGVTEFGTIVGTPAYMAPEQAMGKTVDCRSDIYSLGMTLYHLLAGRPPFQAANAVEMLAQQMAETPPPLLGTVDELTNAQHAVIAKMTAKKAAERYADYDDLIRDLQRHAPGVDRFASPLKRIVAETCLLAGFYFFFTISMFTLAMLGPLWGATGRGITIGLGWLVLALFVSFLAIQIVMTGRDGATPGKKLFGFRVVRLNSNRVGYGHAVLRLATAYPLFIVTGPIVTYQLLVGGKSIAAFQAISTGAMIAQIIVTAGSLALLWMHPQRRALHDLAAGTAVVRDGAEV